MQSYQSPDDLAGDCQALCAIEPRFSSVLAAHGVPSLRAAKATLDGLLMIVTEQFLSLAAAASIWQRIERDMKTVTARKILNRSDEALKALGLSTAKVKSFKAVARSGIDFAALARSDDAAIHHTLCALPGIGPWTADIFLLSSLQRRDAWPVGDLALQEATRHLLRLAARPSPRAMSEIAESWRPHRAAAARLLWSHYRGMKGLQQAG